MRPCPSDRCKAASSPLLAVAVSLSGLFVSQAAYAVRPFITDDARIVDHKACQSEMAIQSERDKTEYRVLPSCNLTGNLELTFGGARSKYDDGGTRTTDVVIQGKTLFKSLETNGWGWGLTVGNSRKPEVHRKAIANYYVNVPVSFSFRDDRVVLHANLGGLREKEFDRHRMTWGIASDIQLGERTWMIAETFGQNRGRPLYQTGFRYALIPNHVEIDIAYGNRFGSNTKERWFVAGLRLVSPAFLP
ncbi:MAG: hypothetical protein FWG26_00030 [Betaproteobacteria bacterium]|nr:hypothetical protein [Betaproteobacteria bacterium]